MISGTIEINGTRIGYWEAVNVGLVGIPDKCEYECFITYRDSGGYPQRKEFTVRHNRAEGAVNLSSIILQEAINHLPRP